MRVISGTARGRRLIEPRGTAIRPTADNVKEAVFNIIQFDIEGRAVLDLFAGTGQLGIEALSRGAKSAVFVDESRDAIKLIRDNLKKCGFEDKAKTVLSGAYSFIEHSERFDLIFIDPPYNTSFLDKTLEKISRFDKLNVGGIIICESPAEKDTKELEPPYYMIKSYRYGTTRITLYTNRD